MRSVSLLTMIFLGGCLSEGGALDGMGGSQGNPVGASGTVATGGSEAEGTGGGGDSWSDLVGGGLPNPLEPGATCNLDLTAVIDDKGITLETCGELEKCLNGACVPVCEAFKGSTGTTGCTFALAEPPFVNNVMHTTTYDGPCFAAFMTNSWDHPVKFDVGHGSQTFADQSFIRIPHGYGASISYDPLPSEGLPPGEVAILFLSHRPGAKHADGASLECPVMPALLEDTAIHGSGVGEAFRIRTTGPVTGYQILPFGGAKSVLPAATLLQPVTSWGDNFLIYGPHGDSRKSGEGEAGKLFMVVTAAASNTVVKILPKVTLPGGTGIAEAAALGTTTVTLEAGESFQYIGADPTGTIVESSKPVGVLTGNSYLFVGSELASLKTAGLDSAHQQILPIRALGNEYVGGNIATRIQSASAYQEFLEKIPYRIVGVVNDTVLSWEPNPGGQPTILNRGDVLEFQTDKLFSVRSQADTHPFAMSHYMPGAINPDFTKPGCGAMPAGAKCSLGDDDWVIDVPTGQYVGEYLFFTDPSYATTNLVVTRKAGASGFSDVGLQCLGKIETWMNVGSSGQFQVAHVDLVRAGAAVGSCAVSQHKAESENPFSITVWGTDWFASYGYPAGGDTKALNSVFIPGTI